MRSTLWCQRTQRARVVLVSAVRAPRQRSPPRQVGSYIHVCRVCRVCVCGAADSRLHWCARVVRDFCTGNLPLRRLFQIDVVRHKYSSLHWGIGQRGSDTIASLLGHRAKRDGRASHHIRGPDSSAGGPRGHHVLVVAAQWHPAVRAEADARPQARGWVRRAPCALQACWHVCLGVALWCAGVCACRVDVCRGGVCVCVALWYVDVCVAGWRGWGDGTVCECVCVAGFVFMCGPVLRCAGGVASDMSLQAIFRSLSLMHPGAPCRSMTLPWVLHTVL